MVHGHGLAPLSGQAGCRRAGQLPGALSGADCRGLSGACRWHGAAAVPTAVHRGGSEAGVRAQGYCQPPPSDR
ncbi:hypothetical protein G6F32_016663 [Rhizopus arrhizus]|nr:hypothetical protein G6F32_016663 [Rhizopus arrhizus]